MGRPQGFGQRGEVGCISAEWGSLEKRGLCLGFGRLGKHARDILVSCLELRVGRGGFWVSRATGAMGRGQLPQETAPLGKGGQDPGLRSSHTLAVGEKAALAKDTEKEGVAEMQEDSRKASAF